MLIRRGQEHLKDLNPTRKVLIYQGKPEKVTDGVVGRRVNLDLSNIGIDLNVSRNNLKRKTNTATSGAGETTTKGGSDNNKSMVQQRRLVSSYSQAQ